MTVGHPPAVFAFDKFAEGNDPAKRILEGYHTQLAYPHGVAVDPESQLMYVINNGAVADSYGGAGVAEVAGPSTGRRASNEHTVGGPLPGRTRS